MLICLFVSAEVTPRVTEHCAGPNVNLREMVQGAIEKAKESCVSTSIDNEFEKIISK